MTKALFDIKAVKAEAEKEIRDEMVKKYKTALVTQMRVVAVAEQVVLREQMKLADLEAQISEGSV